MSAPQRRPPLALRALIGIGGLGVALSTAALMLSDRAPGILRRLFGEFAVRLSARLDAGQRGRLVDLAGDPRLPDGDLLVHVALWAVVTVFAGLTVWSLRWLLPTAFVVGAASITVELLQGLLTDTRVVDPTDIAANLAGVAAGTALSLAAYASWSALAAVFSRRR